MSATASMATTRCDERRGGMDNSFANSDDGRQPRLVLQHACGTMTAVTKVRGWGNGAVHQRDKRTVGGGTICTLGRAWRRLNNLVREAKMRIHQLGKAAM